jgi:hypothetical protein
MTANDEEKTFYPRPTIPRGRHNDVQHGGAPIDEPIHRRPSDS